MSSRIVTIGEGLGVLRTAGPGSLAHHAQLQIGTGGAEGNVAIGLARLGIPVTWLGRVGNDSLGVRVARELRAEGVDTIAIVDRQATTGLLIKEASTPETTVVTYYRAGSAGSRLSPADLTALPLEAGDVLHLTGITPALSASARDTVFAALDRAEAAGATISYDVNHRSRLWTDADAIPLHRAITARAHIVFASDDEAELLLGHSSEVATLAAGLADLGPTEVVITSGARGALALREGRVIEQNAIVLPTVVDSVGAGDAFVAGYLSELVAHSSLEQRLLTAVQTGAAACLHPGDWEGAATRESLAEANRSEGSDPVRR